MNGVMDDLARMGLASIALRPTFRTPPTLLIRLILPSSNPSQNAMWGTSHRWPGKQGFYDFLLTTFLWLITYFYLPLPSLPKQFPS